MRSYRITFFPSEKTVDVLEGTTLLEAQIQAGLQPDAPCGGQGKCNKCLVFVLSGFPAGIQKACAVRIYSNMEVDTSQAASGYKILAKGSTREVPVQPWLKAVPFVLSPARLGEKQSDWQRLTDAIYEAGYTADFSADLSLLSRLHGFYQEDSKGYGVLGYGRLLELTHQEPACYLAVFDIGTTTIVGYLLDANSGGELAVRSLLNPQSQYGADVIMRANYAIEHSVEPLTKSVRQAMAEIIEGLCKDARIKKEDVYQMSIVGNTCMSHLLLGLLPDSLVHAPYHPIISQPLVLDAAALGMPIHPRGQIFLLPNIAGFVGADTVGCLLSADFDHRKEQTLLIDIGTNGEMVLGNEKRRVCCSTAAGPAFEGAKITCGMRGATGAIDHVEFVDGVLTYSVIGGGATKGICGSGLMDLLAELLFYGFVDESGRLLAPEELKNPTALKHKSHLKEWEGSFCFILADETKGWQGNPVYLTQKDIREVQLAKAAIAAGISLMTEHLGITISQIQEVLIAGAFGSYMKPLSACRIGLIPYELLERITAVGNAAGEGAKLAILNRGEWEHAKELAEQTEFLELATSLHFQDCFVDELEFSLEAFVQDTDEEGSLL